jgi:nucleotide-binding universal stress UspA family protein
MYADVVIGMDRTDARRDALALAQTLAQGSSQLALAHVRVLEAPALRGANALSAARTHRDSIQLLSAERERAAPAAEILSVLAPDVGSGLRDVAESRGADLLVVGSCRRAATGRVLVGDDSRAVLVGAPCAVAVAPWGYRERAKAIEVIGVAYDDSAQSGAALALACSLSLQTGARVVARHVIAPGVADGEAETARARERLGYLGDAEVSVAVGGSGENLAAFSETVDLLICGSRTNGIVRRTALGGTTDYLSRHCACPLLITTTPALGRHPRVSPRQEPNLCTASRSSIGSAEESARHAALSPRRTHG